MIEVKNLTKIYHSGLGAPDVKALEDVTFSLGEKGLVFVIGKSGGGKSTLLNLLGGLDSPSSGEIFIDGNRLASFDKRVLDRYRNTYVGFIFQEYNLIEKYNVEENVSLALDLQGGKDKEKVKKCLDRVGLGHLSKRKCSELSGGQKQRVALARALVKEPKLILADEPTGALDSRTGTEIMDIFKELSTENLVVVVSHDLTLAKKYADRIIEINNGKITSDTSKENEPVFQKTLSFKNPKLGFSTSFILALRSLRSKTRSLVTTILLSVLSFTLFGGACAISRIDASKAFASVVDGSNNKEISLRYEYPSSLILKSELDNLDETAVNNIFYKPVYRDPYLNNCEVKVVDKGEKNASIKQSPFLKVYDISQVNSFVAFDETDLDASGFAIEGRLPAIDGEIAISKVLYDSLSRRVGLNTYEGLVLETQPLSGNQTVVGIIDNHFDEAKYSNYRNRDLKSNENLKYSLESDLNNSFSTTIYLSISTYKENYEEVRSTMNFNVMDGGASSIWIDTNINTTCDSIEEIYSEYKAFEVKRSNALPESVNFLTRRQFLEEYFVVPEGQKVEELLSDDDQFISLDDDEVVLGFCSENASNNELESFDNFKSGKDSVESSFNCGPYGINKIKAFYLNSSLVNDSENFIFDHRAVISHGNYEFMENNSLGYREIKAVLSDDYHANLEFINFFRGINEFIIWHYSSAIVYGYSNFLSYPINIVFVAAIIVLGIISSLILVNFIGISMSYGKKTMGILRALGAKNSDVLFVYGIEGFLVGLVDGILSVVTSYVACKLMNFFISESIGFSISVVSLSYFESLITFCCSIVLSLLAVAVAVLKNRKSNPIDLVRSL